MDLVTSKKFRKDVEALIRTYDNITYINVLEGNSLIVHLNNGKSLVISIIEIGVSVEGSK